MERTPVTAERTTRRSSRALPGLGLDGQLGMPLTWPVGDHVRLPFSSNLYVSGGSALG